MKKSRTIVCHGFVTHPLGAKCKDCQEVHEWFARSGLAITVEMIARAAEGANKDQRKLIKRYEKSKSTTTGKNARK